MLSERRASEACVHRSRGTGRGRSAGRSAGRSSAGTRTHGGERGAGYRNLTSPSLPLSFADIFHAVTAFPSCKHRWKKPPVCAAEALTNSCFSYPAAASQLGGAPGSPGPCQPTLGLAALGLGPAGAIRCRLRFSHALAHQAGRGAGNCPSQPWLSPPSRCRAGSAWHRQDLQL